MQPPNAQRERPAGTVSQGVRGRCGFPGTWGLTKTGRKEWAKASKRKGSK